MPTTKLENHVNTESEYHKRQALDAVTIQTVSDLWMHGINMLQIQSILGLDCPKRLGAIVRALRRDSTETPVPETIRSARPVTSVDWFIQQPQRLLRATIAVRVYQMAKEEMRASGVIQKKGLMKARLILQTFRSYLDLYQIEPAKCDFTLPRIRNLIDLYESGALVFRTCRKCRREHITDGNHHHSALCPSCIRINTSFCACGQPVKRASTGRRPDRRVQCASCKPVESTEE